MVKTASKTTGMTKDLFTTSWNQKKVASALEFLEPRQAVFLNYFTELLNEYHGWDRSPAYYDLLCGEWLLHFSHVSYAAYLEVERGGGYSTDLSPLPVFADHGEYQRASYDSYEFNRQFRALITEVLEQGRGLSRSFAQPYKKCGDGALGARSRIRNVVKSTGLRILGGAKAPFVFCRPYIKCMPSEWYSTLWRWRHWARQSDYVYPMEITAQVDADWRCRHSEKVLVATFLDLFQVLLPLYVPIIYLEGFITYREKAFALDLPRPKVLYTANSLHGHVLFKTLAADWREEGTKLINHQHGGGYGIDRIHAIENFETRVADCFYTTGWRSSPKQVPLAVAFSPALFKHERKSEQNRVLLTCVAFPKYVYRIHFHPMPGTIEMMISNTADFVREIKGRQELVFRPCSEDYGWGSIDTLRKANPELILDDIRIPGPSSYARSALVVHNYLGTSWLETLAMNIPTVCFYNTDTYAFRDAAQPFINDLAAVGILHQSGSDAARFVLSIKNDIQGWWQRPEVQDARLAFVSNYANFSPDWAQKWEAEFRQWIE